MTEYRAIFFDPHKKQWAVSCTARGFKASVEVNIRKQSFYREGKRYEIFPADEVNFQVKVRNRLGVKP